MSSDLLGKTIIVTGGARGQGAAEAKKLVQLGANVVVGDLNEDAGAELVTELAGGPGTIRFFKLDVTDENNWRTLVQEVAGATGTIDGLVNNAGIAVPGRLGSIDLESWNKSFAVNVTGAMLGMQAVAPHMPEGSSIVNIGSVASVIAHHNAAYGAAKWALRGLSKSAAVEFAPFGIRVNMVHPGYIKTPLNANADPRFLETHLKMTPARRGGEVDEIADAVIFLLSSASSYITGVELPVDGGFSSHGGNIVVFDALGRPEHLENIS